MNNLAMVQIGVWCMDWRQKNKTNFTLEEFERRDTSGNFQVTRDQALQRLHRIEMAFVSRWILHM
jgi:hypothetical protein